MSRAVGDGTEYYQTPSRKAFRIRLKFLNNSFLQGVTEDFMSTQNLERKVDASILTTDALFSSYGIAEREE